jgi:alkyldihydroxyacetonephosphate synthase
VNPPNRGAPTPPIALEGDGVRARFTGVDVDDTTVARLADVCADVRTDTATLAESGRDWWPIAMRWALDGEVPALAAAVAKPASVSEVAAVMSSCNEARVPLTVAAGRSGVCGGSVPVHGGVILDLTGLAGIVDVDDTSMLLDVRAGTFGDVLEEELRPAYEVTVGHWPQSVNLSTVGGWLACRGAGQYSNRYGKIEDMVFGLDVALADGRQISTGGSPRQAVGPDLTQLFVGSEGTLGVITGARLRLHGAPRHERRSAFTFPTFVDGLDVMRRIFRRGATPAVLRLYDSTEADRTYKTGDDALLLVLDEGDPAIVETTIEIVAEECMGAPRADLAHVETWMHHRNDVSALEALISRGFVVDTMEISARWANLPRIYTATIEALRSVPGTIAASAHQSHSYRDGGCLYFTFAGKVEADDRDRYYRSVWDTGSRAVLAAGGALSHHHGVGLNRSRFMAEALGPALDVLVSTKAALDPNGILNPGKLGLPSPFGSSGY